MSSYATVEDLLSWGPCWLGEREDGEADIRALEQERGGEM